MKADEEFIFQDKAILDVTYLNVTSPDEPLGYMGDGIVTVFPDGTIKIDDGEEEPEEILFNDILRMNTDIHSHDPDHGKEISILTETKDVRLTFFSVTARNGFVKAVER